MVPARTRAGRTRRNRSRPSPQRRPSAKTPLRGHGGRTFPPCPAISSMPSSPGCLSRNRFCDHFPIVQLVSPANPENASMPSAISPAPARCDACRPPVSILKKLFTPATGRIQPRTDCRISALFASPSTSTGATISVNVSPGPGARSTNTAGRAAARSQYRRILRAVHGKGFSINCGLPAAISD